MESYEIIWKKALPELENSISTAHYTTFIKFLEPIDLVGSTLVLLTKAEVFAKTIKTKLKNIIVEVLVNLNTGVTDIEIFQGSSKKEYLESKVELLNDDKLKIESSPIDPKYTFDSFVVGASNRYLYAAAKAVAEAPGESYNPLFIYGASGLGKTHIMQAIANHIHKATPKKKVLYSTCEKFTTELITNIKTGKAYSQEGENFRNKYRNVDVLIIDDVQFLARKETTQEEFFNTFNALYGENKQIVLSADCEPSKIELLDERLRTRFEGGLKAQVLAPDIETKVAILQKKAEYKKYILPLDVAMFMAENSEDNVRSLEGMLNRVIFFATLHEEPITLNLAMDALKDSVTSEIKESVSASKVIDTVCSYYNISKADITSKKRNKELVLPRQICAYLMTELMSIPLVTIGEALGGKNYTTIIHSRDKIAELIKFSDKILTSVNDIKNLILKK
ncbi:MAG: chromosomal replication initiator protein DnaA [Clostridia bacterium]|nr:chromosomal replication initiator protein DnaA [Clostridia bacterium]